MSKLEKIKNIISKLHMLVYANMSGDDEFKTYDLLNELKSFCKSEEWIPYDGIHPVPSSSRQVLITYK